MSQLIESIRIYNGKVYNINLHNDRCNKSRKELFGSIDFLDLMRYINIPENFSKGLVKCRITYNREVQNIEFSHYSIRNIKSIKLVWSDYIRYPYKYLARPELDELYNLRGLSDEIIIIRNGLITDAYYYNIVISIKNKLYTPEDPILAGTMRQKLIDQNKILTAKLTVEDLRKSEKIFLINAMTPLKHITIKSVQVLK